MRWLVDVTSLGKIESESLQVDADTWQGALQGARAQRGESASMSGFSVEVNDNGCRAVDAISRLRYDVTQIAETAEPDVASASAAQGPAGLAPGLVPPRPSLWPAKKINSFSPSFGPVSDVAAVVVPPGVAAIAAHPVQSIGPAPGPPSPSRAAELSRMPVQVVFKREQERTQALPLTYREYVYVVPADTTEQDAQALLYHQLDLVRTSLAPMPAGKLVNLAVFDAQFQGKPRGTPLATLMWKDWRGAAVISAPRREAEAQTASSSQSNGRDVRARAAEPAQATLAVAPPVIADAPPVVATSAPLDAPVTAPAAASMPAPAMLRDLPPTEKSTDLLPSSASAPPDTASADPGFMLTEDAQANRAKPGLSSDASPARTRESAQSAPMSVRVRGDDLVADLFEAMHDLHFLRDALEGGDFCLAVAMEKIPSRAGFVHLYDIDRREFVITSTRGADAAPFLLQRHDEKEKLLAGAMLKRKAVVLADAIESEVGAIERYVAVGGARSAIVAPVMQSGRFLGVIELLNPLDGHPFTSPDGDAVGYIAGQFAEFVAARGVITDPERVSARRPRA